MMIETHLNIIEVDGHSGPDIVLLTKDKNSRHCQHHGLGLWQSDVLRQHCEGEGSIEGSTEGGV